MIATYSSTQVKEPQLPFLRMMYLDLTLHLVIVYAMPEAAKKHAIADITQAFRHGMLLHRIADRIPLAEIARANEKVELAGPPGAWSSRFPDRAAAECDVKRVRHPRGPKIESNQGRDPGQDAIVV